MKQEYSLPRVSPESAGISSEAVLAFITALDNWAGGEKHGVMLARHGKVFSECWWAPFTPGRAHIGWSVSKTYTGAAIGIAIKEGLLSLDTRLVDVFPEYAPKEISENLSKLCIRHMLSMTGGMKDMSPEGPGWLKKYINTPVEYEPGTTFLYNTMGINALGAVIQKVAGQTMHEYLIPRLYEKLGMNVDNVFWTYIPGGYEWCGGGIFCTTEDNLRLAMLYEQGGMWNGERILPADYVQLSTTARIGTNPCTWPFGMVDEHPEAQNGYGYTLWMNREFGAYRAFGAHGQFAAVFPGHNLTLSSHLNSIPEENHIFSLIYELIIPNLSSAPLPENPAAKARLDHFCATRAFPRPVYQPFSPMIPQVTGKRYNVAGDLSFITAFEPREYKGSGVRVSDGISSFDMRFEDARRCEMSFIESGKHCEVTIAIDGGRMENRIEVSREVQGTDGGSEVFRHTPTEVLLSGFWETDTLFTVRARWIQSSVEKTVWFEFSEDGNTVKTTGKLTSGRLGAYESAPENAVGTA